MAARVVLLDLDGTLADSAPGILAAYRAMLGELGHAPDPAISLTHVIGPAVPDVMPVVLAPYGDTRIDLAISTYRRIYGEIGVQDATPYAGVPDLLVALKAAGRRVFTATAKRSVYARQMLKGFGLLHLFDHVYGSEPGGALDHKPELIAHILAQERIDPADAVMVGDRHYDMTGAHANGVRALAAGWGYGSRAELEQAGADVVLESPAALQSVLLDPAPSVARAARAGDLALMMPLIARLGAQNVGIPMERLAPAWAALLASGVTTPIVVEAGGVLVATCTLAMVPNLTHGGRPYGVVENVATLAGHEGRGLAGRALRFAFGRAWAGGCYKVMLSTASQTERTLGFYESVGFTRDAKTFFEVRPTLLG